MSEVFQGSDGELVALMGPWKDPEHPEAVTPEADTLKRWLQGEDIPIVADLIREEFRRQERFRNDVKIALVEAARELKKRCEQIKENTGAPIPASETYDHGFQSGELVAYRFAQQLMMDVLNIGALGMMKEK